ncbi:MAG TPA: LPS assembly lipoprotein LptE [Gammaproteobacteria bacterium]|nr:LPS assembly lipoprotein LptE [Gammaproteobacteria bacterium]
MRRIIIILSSRIKRYSPAALVGLSVLLSACGFRLQGSDAELPAVAVQTYLDTDDPYTDFYASLRDALRDRGATVVESPTQASGVLRILEDDTGQRILSVSARNVPREYEVFYVVTFSFEADGSELLPPESLVVTRSYTYDETQVLGKSAEEGELRLSLARDLATRVLRRLTADRQPVPAT